MDRASSRTGYESVSHSDEIFNYKNDYNPENAHAQRQDSGSLFEKQTAPEVELQPPIFEDDRTFWQRCNSFWVWEITACLISLACLAVVIRTLFWLDDKPRSAWTLGIQPNTFLSVFVTISRFMMLVGVAEGIGQLRWMYYLGGSRRLDHLDTFESASRGPWGSLLFTCRQSIQGMAPFIARFGALIMIVALAMDPFTQQIVKIEQRQYNSTIPGEAWVLATAHDRVTSSGDSASIDTDKRRAIYGGILGYSNPINYYCMSGNCTFDAFTSMGYEIACQDVAATAGTSCVSGAGTLGVDCSAILYTTPTSNLSLTLQNGSSASTSNTNGTKEYTLLRSTTSDPRPKGYKSPILFSFFIAQLLARRDNDSYNAMDLLSPKWNLTACDAKYSGKLYEGVQVLNGQLNNKPPRTLELIPLENSTCWRTDPPSCQAYTVSDPSAVPKSLNTIFTADIDPTPAKIRNYLIFDYNISNSVVADDSAYNTATGLFWNLNVTSSFQNVATLMTDYLRQYSAPQRVNGTAQISAAYMQIRWGWFALPAALDLAGPIFLMCVIVYTARGVNGEKLIWKTNTIPLLLHGLQGYHRHGYAGAETTGAIFRKARQMNVQLRRNADGEIRFVRT